MQLALCDGGDISYIYTAIDISAVNKMAAGERQLSVEVAEIVSLEETVAETDVSRRGKRRKCRCQESPVLLRE